MKKFKQSLRSNDLSASVIIPNWNGKDLLNDCLNSLQKHSIDNFEIILVDNGSEDESIEFTKKHYPQVKIIKLDKNYGFAKAINEGVKASSAPYAVFLNNDTAVDEDWLKSLIECAQNHNEAISVNSKILNFYDHKIIDGVGILINEAGQARSIGWQEEDKGQYDKETYIFGATGGASLFKREEFLKLGGFDESYFMYSEEVDFSFRAQFAGFKSIYCPKAVVYHKHKATSKKLPEHIEYWQFRNMTMTIIKDFPGFIIFKNLRWLKIILVHLNTIFYQLKKGFFRAPFMADLWILLNLPKLLSQRKKIQKNIKVTPDYLESFFAPKPVTFWGLRR